MFLFTGISLLVFFIPSPVISPSHRYPNITDWRFFLFFHRSYLSLHYYNIIPLLVCQQLFFNHIINTQSMVCQFWDHSFLFQKAWKFFQKSNEKVFRENASCPPRTKRPKRKEAKPQFLLPRDFFGLKGQ